MILYNYVIYCKYVTNNYINDCNEFFIQVCFIQNLHSVFVRSFINHECNKYYAAMFENCCTYCPY